MERTAAKKERVKTRERGIVRASFVGIAGNIVLTTFKLIVGIMAHSIAIILDAVNNATDVLSSVLTIVGTKLADRRASRRYPYGFGRIEYMTSLVIAEIILVAGGISLWEAIMKVISPSIPDYQTITLVVIIASIVIKIAIGIYMKIRGRKLNSGALIASGVDSNNDAVLTGGTLVAALAAIIWNINIDGLIGIIISIFVLKTGVDIIKDAVNPIIGIRPDTDLGDKLKEFISSHEGVLGTYDVFLDDFGPNEMIGAAHIEIADSMDARHIHELTRRISEDVFNQFGIMMTIGIYATNSDEQYREMYARLRMITDQYPEILQVHGFYVDDELSIIMFDLVIDFAANGEAIQKHVISEMQKEYPEYTFKVTLDVDYVG